MNEVCVIIPATKKNVAFPDDLVKKLNGASLIQRAIDKAKGISSNKNIYVITDSEEISLICERNEVNHVYKNNLRLRSLDILKDLRFFLIRISKKYENTILLWPYAPLIRENEILMAYEKFLNEKCDILTSIKEESHRFYRGNNPVLGNLIIETEKEKLFAEIKAFSIIKLDLIKNNGNRIKVHPFVLNDNEAIEINSYQDWWVCEKLLKRKRIIFNVIGSDKIGMGHIYRSLTLAHEITDHEIIFVCNEQSRIAVDKIAGYDYLIKAFNPHVMEEQILSLKPDLVINDTLDTTKKYIMRLKENNIKVVNFEDLGPGARYTDVTINEVFDEPKFNSKNTKWGNKYFFLRDEFNDARPHKLAKKVENLLITFGGTDQNNYTQKTLTTIVNFCKKENIKIYIVNGDGYLYKEQLSRYLKELGYKNLEFTFATAVISKIMEKTQIAITSNGRTTYELAHMNIPSIVISHHERENTHRFAVEERGFINLGCYKKGATENLLLRALKKVVYDNNYRKRLFDNIKIYNFSKNKKKVVKLVLNLLEAE